MSRAKTQAQKCSRQFLTQVLVLCAGRIADSPLRFPGFIFFVRRASIMKAAKTFAGA